jgi:hypothetical protein
VADVECRENALVACPEEIALQRGPIERHQFARLASTQMNSDYGRYLTRLLDLSGGRVKRRSIAMPDWASHRIRGMMTLPGIAWS